MVYTVHKALRSLSITSNTESGRLATWMDRSVKYHLKLFHRLKAKANQQKNQTNDPKELGEETKLRLGKPQQEAFDMVKEAIKRGCHVRS